MEAARELLALTELEVRVLACAAQGMSTRATATELDYSPAWIREQRGAAMRKLSAPTITAAVAVAMRLELLPR